MATNDPVVVVLNSASNYNDALWIVLVMFGAFVALFVAINAWVKLPADNDAPCDSWRLVAVGAGIWLVLAILPAAYYGEFMGILPAILGWGLFRTLYESRINESRERATLPQGVTAARRMWIPLTGGEVQDLQFLVSVGAATLLAIGAFGLLLLSPEMIAFKVTTGVAILGLVPLAIALNAVRRRQSYEEISKPAPEAQTPPRPQRPRRRPRRNPPSASPANP